MKKIILISSFSFLLNLSFGQEKNAPYIIKEKNQSFNLSKLEKLDVQMIDLYRSQSVDNDVTIIVDGQQIVVTLLSADKMKAQGIVFDEGLVKKGAMMSGDAAKFPRKFTWKIENNTINDITVY